MAVLVDGVSSISEERSRAKGARTAAASPAVLVRFAGGSTARLDPAKPRDRAWADVLQSLRESKLPVYVEVEPETGYLTSVLLPRQFLVTAIRDLDTGDREIELEISHARHYLRRGYPRFADILQILDDARKKKTPVLVTESLDSSAIIDVRPANSAGARRRP